MIQSFDFTELIMRRRRSETRLNQRPIYHRGSFICHLITIFRMMKGGTEGKCEEGWGEGASGWTSTNANWVGDGSTNLLVGNWHWFCGHRRTTMVCLPSPGLLYMVEQDYDLQCNYICLEINANVKLRSNLRILDANRSVFHYVKRLTENHFVK